MTHLEEAPFATRMTEIDGGVVVAVQGPLDAYTVDEVTQTLLSIPTGTRALLDLSAVSFVDSRALHHLRVVLRRRTTASTCAAGCPASWAGRHRSWRNRPDPPDA